MKSVLTLSSSSQLRTAFAVNSVPLSERMYTGAPRSDARSSTRKGANASYGEDRRVVSV